MGVGGQEMPAGKKCQIIPGGFAGSGPNGSFFEAPAWVDKDKAPGMTSQAPVVAPPGWYVAEKLRSLGEVERSHLRFQSLLVRPVAIFPERDI